MSRSWRIGWILALLALSALGLARVRFDVDVLNLLPADSPVVRGLATYQRHFTDPDELILSVRAAEAARAIEAAEALSSSLSRAGLAAEVVWRAPWDRDPTALAELLAWLWFNRPPRDFREMAERFDDDRIESTVFETLERLTTSMNPRELALLPRDPYRLTELPADVAGIPSMDDRDAFASADGRLRLLFAQAPAATAGFWGQRDWLSEVTAHVDDWRRAGFEDVTVRLTGDPAFVAEVGSGMLADMRQALVGTFVIVGLLFWLAHRRLRPLAWMLVLLALVLAATAAAGSLVFGALNAVSVGFAAILLGLAVDYALILYQEYVEAPELPVGAHVRAVAPSILWASATTAGAFFMVSRGSLPGLQQLGTLVAIGIVLAAATMLLAFLPPVAGGRALGHRGSDGSMLRGGAVPGRRPAWWITVAVLAGTAIVLGLRPPVIDNGIDDLGPRDAAAQRALAEIQREIGGEDEPLWLLVEASGAEDMQERLAGVRTVLERAEENGSVASFVLTDFLWPAPAAQAENRAVANGLTRRENTVATVAAELGFAADGLALTQGVFAAWRDFGRETGVSWPRQEASRWVMRRFVAREADRLVALVLVDPGPRPTPDVMDALARELREASGAELCGWTMLSESLLGTMRRDATRVLVPMVVLLLLMLGLAFRGPGAVLLSFGLLAFTLAALSAVMALAGWSWNLMNVTALPLLLGAGVDYSIHVQLALRRHAGDVARVRRSVGRAVLLCSASTAAGFGTLAFASNAGLASLGRVSATGIAIAGLTSVALLPIWWKTFLGERT